MGKLFVALLHEGMIDRQQRPVTTSLTLLDVHDIARSSCSYGVTTAFVVHPHTAMRSLGEIVIQYWRKGFGATYNTKRKEALAGVEIRSNLEEVVSEITSVEKARPLIISTSAARGGERVSFRSLRHAIASEERPFLVLVGTGWGMGPELLAKADVYLEPITGPVQYNHLSVRSATAIILDRLVGVQDPLPGSV